MPVYQYQGQHYDLPDGLSNEDAIAKIKSHLGKKEESPVEGFGKQVAGLAEAGASVLAPLPSTIVGGLAGLGDVLSGKGITQGAETLKKIQDWNFGAGAYVPYTEKGKQLSKKTGELLNKPAEFAGDIGEEIGGNLGRANAEFATNVLMNFIPIGGGMMIKSAAKGRAKTAPKELSTKLTALEDAAKPVVAPKVPEAPDLSIESPTRATMRVAEQNKGGLPKAEDFNNRDANVRAVEEEIAANEARQAFEAQAATDADKDNGRVIPKGQRGAIDLGTSPEPGKDHPLTALKLTPVQVQDARKQSAVKSVLGNAYVDNITSPEQVLAAVSNGAKDVGPIAAARMKSMGSGLNSAVLSSNNPLLKFGRNAIRTAEKAAEAITTKFITSKDGAGPQWNRLSQAEKNEVAEVLYSQDKHQKFYTPDQLKASGYNERQIKLINHIREMEAEKLRIWNEKRAEVGKPPVEAREGHFPGIFKGDYRTLIVDKDNNPIGFIGTLTKWGNKSVQDKMRATYPDAKFLDLGRKDMGNISNRRNVSGIEELIQLLAEHDPKFAEMQDKISAITSDNADKLYGAEYHARHKKGIIGSEGNKPWQDKTANTNEMMKAYFQYFEEGMLSHMNLPVETQLKALMSNPALDGMPNAKAYLSKYVQHMTGRNPGKLAAAIDTLIDTPGRAVGLGPTPVRNAINQTTKRIGQLLMGYGNIAHSAMQMMQVPTMAFPEFRTIAHQFNIPESVSAGAGMEGVRLLGEMSKEKLTGKKSTLSAYDRTVLDYAEHMGLGHFSEFQDVSKQTQGPRGRAFDDAVDLNRTLPEVTTRPYVFFTISKMLEKHPELSLQEKLSVAYNATQEAMIDYSPRERPMVYSDLGKMGQLTGSLSTFTHGAFGQLGRLGKEAVRGNPVPIISAAAIMFALGGVKGIWGYDTADTIVKYLTEQLGNRRSIRELLLDPHTSSEVIKSGALSVATGADLSSRISVNIPTPGSITEAVAGPFATDLGKRVGSIYELAKEQDSLAAKNALITNLPNSIKKIVRDKMMEDEETGANIASTGTQAGLPGNPRTAQDKTLSKWGVTSLPESLLNETQYNDQRRNMAKADERKQIVKDAVRAYRQLPDEAKQKAMEQFKDKYMAAQGDPQQWVNALVEEGITEGKSKQQRLQGIPSDTLGSIYRYNNFERSRNMEKQRNATKP